MKWDFREPNVIRVAPTPLYNGLPRSLALRQCSGPASITVWSTTGIPDEKFR